MHAWKAVVKVWCLPGTVREDALRALHRSIVSAVRSADIGIETENDFMTLFPADLMKYGAGEEIYVEVRTQRWIDNFAQGQLKRRLRDAVHEHFPLATVGVDVDPDAPPPS